MSDITKTSNFNEVAKTNEEVKATAMAVVPTQDEAVTATAVAPTAETATSVSEGNKQAETTGQMDGIVIYSEDGKDDVIRAWIDSDKGYRTMQIVLSLVSSSTGSGQNFRVSRSAIANDNKALDFLYDTDTDLTIEKAQEAVRDFIGNNFNMLPKRTVTINKISIEEMVELLRKIAHSALPEDYDSVHIKDGKIVILNSYFDLLVKEEGFEGKEVKLFLLDKGMLKTQNHGLTYRFHCKDGTKRGGVVFEDRAVI